MEASSLWQLSVHLCMVVTACKLEYRLPSMSSSTLPCRLCCHPGSSSWPRHPHPRCQCPAAWKPSAHQLSRPLQRLPPRMPLLQMPLLQVRMCLCICDCTRHLDMAGRLRDVARCDLLVFCMLCPAAQAAWQPPSGESMQRLCRSYRLHCCSKRVARASQLAAAALAACRGCVRYVLPAFASLCCVHAHDWHLSQHDV